MSQKIRRLDLVTTCEVSLGKQVRSELPCRESAGVLVLVAIMIFVLVAMVALAIELSIISAASEQARQLARVASLSAIEEFYANIEPECEQQCVNDAIDSAVIKVNQIFEDVRLFSEQGALDPPTVSLNPQGDEARLIPGLWLAEEVDSFICGQGWAEDYPCFVEITPEPERLPNAFRIEGTFFPSITLKMGAKIFNVGALRPFVAATATFMPRRGCFLVDVSPSIVHDSHLPWTGGGPFNHPAGWSALAPGAITVKPDCGEPTNPDCGPPLSEAFGNQYAYFYQPDNASAPPETSEYLFMFPAMDVGWKALSEPPPGAPSTADRGGFPFQQFKHYASDYAAMYLLSDDDYGWAGDIDLTLYHPDPDLAERYRLPYQHKVRVDVFGDSIPEPLNSFMDGINEALVQFQARQVAGDKACLIFFDRRVSWPRLVQMTDDFEYLIEFTDFSNPGNIGDDTGPPNFGSVGVGEGRERTVRHGILPFRAQFTDIQTALQEAMLQIDLARADGVPASEFVVVISDGLQNCYYGSSAGGIGEGVQCNNLFEYYQEGMDQIYKKIEPDNPQDPEAFRRVPIHFILDGAAVGPHTVDLVRPGDYSGQLPEANDQVNCYTDKEYRAKDDFTIENIKFIKGLAGGGSQAEWQQMSQNDPFFQANMDWYKVALVTQGLWGPLRQRNDQFCDDQPEFDGLPQDQKYFDPAEYRPLCMPEDNSGAHSLDGRRIRDPYCMTKQRQIRQYLNSIIGDNPYTVVEIK